MTYRGLIKSIDGNKITLELDEPFDVVAARHKTEDGKSIELLVEVNDYRTITPEQRRMLFGLFRDISEYTGYPTSWIEDFIKSYYAAYKNLDKVSLSHDKCTIVQASELLEMTIEFCYANEIPFKFQEFQIASDISRILFLHLKYRRCFICGAERSQVAHFESVGMGRNRNRIDHSQHRLMCLCAKHHTEQHTIGIKQFMQKHHIVPMKLKAEQLKEMGIKGVYKNDNEPNQSTE